MARNLNLRTELDAEQYAAVMSTKRRLLCLANAGSGKTRMLTFRAANFIANGFPEESVLMLTFTRKAAEEMRSRIAGLLGTERLRSTAGTFHGVACRMVRQYPEYAGLSGGFSVFDTDVTKLWLRQALDAIRDENPTVKKLKDRPTAAFIQKEYSFCRNTGADFKERIADVYDGDDIRADICMDAVSRYEAVKRATPALDFDDLLLKFAEMLDNPSFRELMHRRFPAVFVDEYQDINFVQHEIVRKLLGPNSYLTAVGDDAQCIYGFRGSRVDFVHGFEKEYQDACVLRLPRNYRSSEKIVDASAAVLNGSPYREGGAKEIIPVRTEPCPSVRYLYAGSEASQAAYIASDCLAAKSRMDWKDIAVLVRTKADAAQIEAALLKAGVPVSKECGIEFYKKEQIAMVVRYLQFLRTPGDKAAFAKFIGKCPKIGQKTIDALFDAISSAEFDMSAAKTVKAPGSKDNKLYATILDALDDACGILKSGHSEPKLLAESLIDGFVRPWCEMKYADSEEELTERLLEIEQLVEQLEIYPDLDSFLENAVLDAVPESDKANTGPGRVRIMTIHKAKGLEFKKVFLPGMSQGLVPSFKQTGILFEMQEELRVVYVAMTRAMDELDVIAIKRCARIQGPSGTPAELIPSEFFENMRFEPI